MFDDFDAELANSDPATEKRFSELVHQGAALLQKHKYDTARGVFHQALEIQPRSSAAQLGLARTLYEENNLAAAEKVTGFLVAQDPRNARAHFLLGSILQASGQTSRAKRAFEECVSLDPNGQFGRSAKQILAGL